MKATELRINNIVKTELDVLVKVNYENIRCQTFADSGIGEFKGYEPIIITEEILPNIGFEWDIYYQGFTDGNWVLTRGEKGFRLAYGKRRNDFIVYGIECLHLLQNIIYFLTNRELTINL